MFVTWLYSRLNLVLCRLVLCRYYSSYICSKIQQVTQFSELSDHSTRLSVSSSGLLGRDPFIENPYVSTAPAAVILSGLLFTVLFPGDWQHLCTGALTHYHTRLLMFVKAYTGARMFPPVILCALNLLSCKQLLRQSLTQSVYADREHCQVNTLNLRHQTQSGTRYTHYNVPVAFYITSGPELVSVHRAMRGHPSTKRV